MKTKKHLFLLLAFVLWWTQVGAQTAKYVFYFIGDGMGINQVQATQYYKASLDGTQGISPLGFAQFPFVTVASTWSDSSDVTDSAASGTALATGYKTKNGTLGLLSDWQTPVKSIAYYAHQAGRKVGIATTVSVDHATPAAFYAHVPKRKQYFAIGKDLVKSGYDFFAGSDFKDPHDAKNGGKADLYRSAREAGYVIARGYDDFVKQSPASDKIILLQTEEASRKDRASIPYMIDRHPGDLTLKQITQAAITHLTKNNDKGFFAMIEGGKIDWACHSNDAAAAVREVIDFDEAIQVAYDFYRQHPDETLIVITADHETGGIVLGKGPYALNMKALQSQKVSEYTFTKKLKSLRTQYNNKVPWQPVKELLKQDFGFWQDITLTPEQENELRNVYDQTMKTRNVKLQKHEYSEDEPLAGTAKKIISEQALIGWTSGGHSAGFVPVYAVGVGAEAFHGTLDNALLPQMIARIAGYPLPMDVRKP